MVEGTPNEDQLAQNLQGLNLEENKETQLEAEQESEQLVLTTV